jgi:formylglycine-generating enzyme required for sulfatase activity
MSNASHQGCILVVMCISQVLGVACNTHETSLPSVEEQPSLSSTTASSYTADSTDSVQVEGWLPLEVSTTPFVFDSRWPDCVHPGVVQDCKDGWCKIPAGCYVFGSSADTPGRGAVGEEQGPVTFTYDMEVMQTELTWAEYDRITSWPRKTYMNKCEGDQCPANMSWWEAMLLANILAERHEPPLERCYELGEGCVREPGDRMSCPNYKLTRPGHTCTGYRLPNQFEWQYLARGGTPTDFYTGNMVVTGLGDCTPDPALEKIAWYCGNSEGPTAKPVGQFLPNRWGLYDLFGNVMEMFQTLNFAGPGVAVVDPVEPDATGQRLTDAGGGNAIYFPRGMRAAAHSSVDFAGIRLVRTLGPGVLPQLPPN